MKKILSLILAVMMLLPIIRLKTASADGYVGEYYTLQSGDTPLSYAGIAGSAFFSCRLKYHTWPDNTHYVYCINPELPGPAYDGTNTGYIENGDPSSNTLINLALLYAVEKAGYPGVRQVPVPDPTVLKTKVEVGGGSPDIIVTSQNNSYAGLYTGYLSPAYPGFFDAAQSYYIYQIAVQYINNNWEWPSSYTTGSPLKGFYNLGLLDLSALNGDLKDDYPDDKKRYAYIQAAKIIAYDAYESALATLSDLGPSAPDGIGKEFSITLQFADNDVIASQKIGDTSSEINSPVRLTEQGNYFVSNLMEINLKNSASTLVHDGGLSFAGFANINDIEIWDENGAAISALSFAPRTIAGTTLSQKFRIAIPQASVSNTTQLSSLRMGYSVSNDYYSIAKLSPLLTPLTWTGPGNYSYAIDPGRQNVLAIKTFSNSINLTGIKFEGPDLVPFSIQKIASHIPVGYGVPTLDYSNCEFQIYKGSDIGSEPVSVPTVTNEIINKLTTDSTGKTQTVYLEPGDYTIVETAYPDCWIQGQNVQITISESDTSYELNFENPPITMGGEDNITICKSSAATAITDGNANYSLIGATFELRDMSDNVFATVTTQVSSGRAVISNVTPGTYKIVETSASPGYLCAPEQIIVIDERASVENVYVDILEPPMTGTIMIQKRSGDADLTSLSSDYSLAGAVFEVFNSSDVKVGEITTTASGMATMTNLPLGSYTVKEKTASQGYLINENIFSVSFVAANYSAILGFVPATVVVDETPKSGKVVITKTSSNSAITNGNENYSLVGAEFGVFTTPTGGTSIGTIIIGQDGTGESNLLPVGTYYVREVTAPQGYLLSTQTQMISITGTTTSAPQTIQLTFVNTPMTGSIRVVKYSSDEDITDSNPLYSLENATFELYRGSVANAQQAIYIKESNTDEYGYATFSDLPLGDYFIKETTPSTGYLLNSTLYPVTITSTNANSTIDVKVPETPESGNISILKYSTNPELTDSYSSYSLEGATFEVYNAEEIKIGELTTREDGSTIPLTVPLGSYTIKETVASNGFKINTRVFDVAVTPGSTSYTVQVPETPFMGKITINKVSDDPDLTNSNPYYSLEGAVFKIYDESNVCVATLTTDANGQATSEDLPLGRYTVRETSASQGYLLGSERPSVSLLYTPAMNVPGTNFSAQAAVTIREFPQYGEIYLQKISSSPNVTNNNQDFSLQGAEFEIKNAEGDVVETIVTNYKGVAVSNELPLGDYTIVETVSSKGFLRNNIPQAVTIEWDPEENVPTSFVDINEPVQMGKITIQKESADTTITEGNNNYSLEGAEFDLFDSNRNLVESLTTGADGSVTSSLVPVGTYYVVETMSSEGYTINVDEYLVTLTYNATVEEVSQNIIVSEVPQTMAIAIQKKDAETGERAQGDASLLNSAYGLYNSDNELIETLTLGPDTARAMSSFYPLGKYYLVELTAPDGYILDSQTRIPISFEWGDPEEPNFVIPITAVDTVKKSSISITKRLNEMDGHGTINLEPNAKFEVYLTSAGSYEAAYDTEKDIIITDENGWGQTKLLPYGSYTVTQIDGQENYSFVDPFTVDIVDDRSPENSIHYELTDISTSRTIKIVKVDAETGNTIPVREIGFTILDLSSDEYIADNAFHTNENGETAEIRLPYGEYLIQEVAETVPDGYAHNAEGIYLDINEDNTEYSSGNLIVVEFENSPIKGRLDIQKTGLAFMGTDELESDYGTLTVPVYQNHSLEGAEFQIIAAEDIVTADGTVREESGALVDTVTYENGQYLSCELYLGNYIVRETVAPVGYTLADAADIRVALEATSAGDNVVLQQVPAENTLARALVSLHKTVETLSAVQSGNAVSSVIGEKNGVGIVFGLYANEDILTIDGEDSILKDALVAVSTTNEEGLATFDIALPLGTYYVKEIATLEDYVLDEAKHEFTLTHDQNINVQNINLGSFTNILEKAVFDISKVDITGDEPVPGALVEIYNEANELVYRAFTDEDGLIENITLSNGNYTYIEVSAPSGYAVYKEATPFSIINGEVVGSTILTDDYTRYIVYKTDSYEHPLEGAKFGLYSLEGELLQTATTNEDGLAEFIGFEYGDYNVKEITPPEGCIASNAIIAFSVDKFWTNTHAGSYDTLFVNIKLTPVVITKVSEDGNEPLANAEIAIYSGEDLVFQGFTNEAGETEPVMLRPGEYTYIELSSPEGYAVNTDSFSFTIEDGNITGVTVLEDDVTRFSVLKVDEHDNPLQGAVFGLYDKETGELIKSARSDNEGIADFTNFGFGLFTVKEISAPENYQLRDAEINFEVDSKWENPTSAIKFINDRVAMVSISKTDISKTKPVAGATIAIRNREGDVVYEGVTKESGATDKVALVNGTYTFTETIAPEGYALNTEVFEFTVLDGVVTGTTTVADEYTKYVLLKQNDEQQVLESAIFGLYDEDGELLMRQSSNKDGMVVFGNIPYGTFTIKEIMAPSGYHLSTRIITITVDGTWTNSSSPTLFVNTKIESTQTGDDGLPVYIIPVIITSLAVAVIAPIFLRKKKKNSL